MDLCSVSGLVLLSHDSLLYDRTAMRERPCGVPILGFVH